MALKFRLWRTSKSDGACRCPGFQALTTEVELEKTELRSVREAQSIAFASV